MKKFLKKIQLFLIIGLILQVAGMPLYSLAASVDKSIPTWASPINYLALGDSLAAGITPQNELGNGYSDFMAASLKEEGTLQAFNKGFTYPGYSTQDVLNDIKKNDLTKPIVGIGDLSKSANLRDSIKNADVITLSAGANDVLPSIKIDRETGALSYDLLSISAGLQKAGTNTQAILKEIYALNPDVHVYVMGYYNPFPFLSGENQKQAEQLLAYLNNAIQRGIEGTTAKYVATQYQIAANATAYLPNPQNIHLSEAGYQVVANQFKEQLAKDQPWIKKNILTAAVQKSAITLSWKAANDDKKVTGYAIYSGNTKIGEVPGETTTFQVKNVNPYQAYLFSVAALDEDGNISKNNPSVSISAGVKQTFTDIEKHGSKEYIEMAAASGIVGGYEDGTFKPNNQLTRAQAASILVKALDLKATEAAPFTDIQGYSKETQEAIAAAYQFGIVKGDKGKFNPSKPVTRGQLALMLLRSYELVTEKPYSPLKEAPFTDINNYNQETKNAITLVYTLEIATGNNGKYLPNDTATRAQAAKMFVKALQLLK